MFFAKDGDLAPRIEVEDNNNPLTAYRYAPLAALETAPTTPAETAYHRYSGFVECAGGQGSAMPV